MFCNWINGWWCHLLKLLLRNFLQKSLHIREVRKLDELNSIVFVTVCALFLLLLLFTKIIWLFLSFTSIHIIPIRSNNHLNSFLWSVITHVINLDCLFIIKLFNCPTACRWFTKIWKYYRNKWCSVSFDHYQCAHSLCPPQKQNNTRIYYENRTMIEL